MPREINLSADEIKALEQDIAAKRSATSEDEAAFLQNVLKQAKAEQPSSATAAMWTWTYRF